MDDTTTALSVLLVVAAPFAGAGLGRLIDRQPRGEAVFSDPTPCRACGAPLEPWSALPLLGYARLRGRCPACSAPLPAWRPWIEAGAAGLAMLSLALTPGPGAAVTAAAFLWLILALAVADWLWLRLPDPLTLALALLVLGGAAAGGPDAAVRAAVGAALGAGAFAAIRAGYAALRGREGLGLGDVKLMVGLGGFAGPMDLPVLVLLAALSALAAAAIGALAGGQAAALRSDRALPFGTALCIAAGVLWLARALGWWPQA